MTITAEQLANRRNQLGSSDIPQLLGFSPYGNAYDLWLFKTGRVQEVEKKEAYISAGNLLESPVLKWLENRLGEPIITDPTLLERAVPDTPIVDHTDGLVKATNIPVEVKTEGVDHPIFLPWGDADTDEVPEYTCLQSHVHMMAYDTELCHVPTFLGGRGFSYFFVKRDEEIVKMIREQAVRFWHENVLADKPPENVVPDIEVVKRIRPMQGEPVAIPQNIIDAWQKAKEEESACAKQKAFYQAEILALLDGKEEGFCDTNLITNLEQARAGYVVEPCSYRVLRLKKKK